GRPDLRPDRARQGRLRTPPGAARGGAERRRRGPRRGDAGGPGGRRREHPAQESRPVIARLVAFGLHQRFVTLALALLLTAGGMLSWTRLPVQERIAGAEVPTDARPTLGALSSVIGEVYRYTLWSATMPLVELKAFQDWVLEREFLKVPGVADVISWGGGIKQYQITLD